MHLLFFVKRFIVKALYQFIIEIDLFVGVLGGAADGGIETCEGGKGRELPGAPPHAHVRVVGRHMMWKVDNILIVRFHNSKLSFVSSNLCVAVTGGGSLLEIHAFENGVLIEFPFDR